MKIEKLMKTEISVWQSFASVQFEYSLKIPNGAKKIENATKLHLLKSLKMYNTGHRYENVYENINSTIREKIPLERRQICQTFQLRSCSR